MLLTDGRFAGGAYDYFVIGSGPAGMSVALKLAEAKKRVLIFESGDLDYRNNSLSNSIGYGHYSGEYWNGSSTRVLGGASSRWSGWCTTLTELALDNPVVGVRWPIGLSDLMPYCRKAAPILDHNPAFIDFETPLLPGFLYRPVPTARPTRFASKYGDTLKHSASIDVALGCSVIGLDANESRSALTAVEYVHHESQRKHQLVINPSQSMVVAAGGIGNARLLLQPRADGTVPVGNESGHVGKFLMEHPHCTGAGECVLDVEVDRYWPPANPGSGMHAVIADEALSRQQGFYACSLQFSQKSTDHDMVRHLSRTGGRPFYYYTIMTRSEMLPSPNNRVFMTGERDRYGVHRPGVRCVLDARDFMNVELTLRALGQSLIALGKGRVRVNNDRIYKQVWGGGHIMGTTRMGQSPSASVVDRDCRVHGYGNLFVAGSSVFPTGGYANPTLTIVALALRLADRLVASS